MFRCVCRLSSKTTATRYRALNPTVRTVAYNAPTTKKEVTLSDNDSRLLAYVWPAFKTKGLARVLHLSLPPTANVLTIDNTSRGTNNNVSSILRFMILHQEQVLKLQENQHDSHPLVLVVQTNLNKEDADTNEVVLSIALQQRERLRGITAIVLDAKRSSVAKSVLKNHKHRTKLEEKKAEAPVHVMTDVASNTTAVVPVKNEKLKSEGDVKRHISVVKRTSKGPTTTKTPATTTETELTQNQKASLLLENDAEKDSKVDEGNKDRSPSPSHNPSPGAMEARSTPVVRKCKNSREPLRELFKSSLAAPFQPSNKVERALFTGYVEKVRLSDLLNLPVYGGGKVYVLYYRLTGAGACRTPLITIAHILEEECRRKLGDKVGEVDVLSTNRVPMLLLLGATFLISEDANLICQEYQKALEEKMSLLADVTVVSVPNCFTEKNVLFALRSASVQGRSGVGVGHGQQQGSDEETGEGGNEFLPTMGLRRSDGGDSVHNSTPSFSENVLRSVVTNALEEVALRHEKSTDHLVSTLNKLVSYWSRERVIELMESLQSERSVLLDATKELEEVQKQLRDTKSVMETLRKHMKNIDEKIKRGHNGEKDAALGDTSELVECVRDLESRLVKSLSVIPSKEQITLDIREELEDVQKNFQSNLNQLLTKRLQEAQEQQSQGLLKGLKQHTTDNVKEQQLTRQILQELPQQIQSAMENALKSLGQHSAEQTTKTVTEERELVESQVSAMCDKLCKTIEAGQERMEKTVVDLISAKVNSDAAINS